MKLGFLQMRSKFGEIKKNVKKASNLLSKVSDATIVMPELFNTGYLFKNKGELMSLAIIDDEPVPTPISDAVANMADDMRAYVARET